MRELTLWGDENFSFFIVCFSLPYCFAAYCKRNAAQPRATEILERLAAGFREMDGYGVKFGVVSGDYEARGDYVVEGDSYYLVLGDAEVFADGAVRREVDNRRREVTVTEVDTASRNILNNPVRAFDFLGSEYTPSLVSEADGRAVVRLTPAAGNDSPGRRCHADGRHRYDAPPLAFVRLRRRTGAGERAGGRAPRWARPAVRSEKL